ncbi:hypothetical protein Hanom_Chr17g01566701 [Helianthus anomalus]
MLKLGEILPYFLKVELFQHCSNLYITPKRKLVTQAIFMKTVWRLWINRNDKVFNQKHKSVNMLLEEIKRGSYWWMANR